MTHEPSEQPGRRWMPGRFFTGGLSRVGIAARNIRTRLPWLLIRPRAPSLRLGIAVAGTLIVVETLVVCSLNVVSGTTGHFGTLYLLGVLVVSTVWALGLSVTTSVASAVAFAYFRNWPTDHFAPLAPQSGFVVVVFLVVALVANWLARLARMGEKFIDLSSDLMCISGPENVMRVNPAYTQILGYSVDELVSRPYLELVVPEDRSRVREALEQLPGSGTPVRLENRVLCNDGSQRWIEWSIAWDRGLYHAVGRDVTERRREHEQLREAEATATASRDALGMLAEQQAALRRVATLVARGVDPSELFNAVAEEMAHQLAAGDTALWRYDPDGSAILVGVNVDPDPRVPLGARLASDGGHLLATVLDTGRPARQNDIDKTSDSTLARVREIGIRHAVGAPIVVDGRVWGAAVVGSNKPEPLPLGTETRLRDFADLVATAIANAASRAQVDELAARQAALRRVATMVARGVDPAELFTAVAEEIVRCLHVDIGALWRYEPDGSAILASVSHPPGSRFQAVGERMTLEGDSAAATVLRTGSAARVDNLQDATGSVAAKARQDGVRSSVGVPVIVGGRIWGVAVVASYRWEVLPPNTEKRIGDFAELVATALANAATRDELIASRARIVAAADDARRRIERDLHDGAQQRLVSLGLQVRFAEGSTPPEQQALKEQLAGIVSGLTAVSSELQQISRGIHPAILSKGGLGSALKTLARRCPVPVNLDVAVEQRLADSVEIAAYYVVAEALTNVAKYAHASEVNVSAKTNGAKLDLSIQDDGIGGADTRNGSGLIGLKDRVEVLGGDMQITSHSGSGTMLQITIPISS